MISDAPIFILNELPFWEPMFWILGFRRYGICCTLGGRDRLYSKGNWESWSINWSGSKRTDWRLGIPFCDSLEAWIHGQIDRYILYIVHAIQKYHTWWRTTNPPSHPIEPLQEGQKKGYTENSNPSVPFTYCPVGVVSTDTHATHYYGALNQQIQSHKLTRSSAPPEFFSICYSPKVFRLLFARPWGIREIWSLATRLREYGDP